MIVAHFKDHFQQPSETFISTLISSLENTRSIILDRYPARDPERLPCRHFSPGAGFGQVASWIERAALPLFSRSPYFEKVLRSQRVQIVHAHFGQLGALIAPVTSRLGLPLVTSFYGKDVSFFASDPGWKGRFDRLWRLGSMFLVLGPSMKTNLVRLGCPEDRIHILPLAVDCSAFPYVDRPSARPGQSCDLLSVGRLIPKKGMDVLIRSAALLENDSSFRLRIAGDGPQLRHLQELVVQLDLSDRISFLGWKSQEEIYRLMSTSQLFVLASRTDPETGETEGTPTVLLEAQATGLPVVSTVHADIPSIVADKVSGLLVPESDPHALAGAIGRLIKETELRLAMGERGRKQVLGRHDSRVVGKRLEEIYHRLLVTEEPPG